MERFLINAVPDSQSDQASSLVSIELSLHHFGESCGYNSAANSSNTPSGLPRTTGRFLGHTSVHHLSHLCSKA